VSGVCDVLCCNAKFSLNEFYNSAAVVWCCALLVWWVVGQPISKQL